MSSSSRSIAAARQKRAGEQSQPVNNSRPVTSISSQGAFAQQYQQQMMNQSIPVSSKNVRVAQNKNQMSGSSGRNNNNANQTQQQQQNLNQNTKISISNAIGLITLRLGRLENIVNDVVEGGGIAENNDNENNNSSIPSNMKVVSEEVFENIINRLNLLESKVIYFTSQNDVFNKEIKELQNSILNMNANFSLFISDTNEKFTDYENALAEIEKNFEVDVNVNSTENENEKENEITSNENNTTQEVIDETVSINETMLNDESPETTQN